MTDDGQWLATGFRKVNTSSRVEIYQLVNGEYVLHETIVTAFELGEVIFSDDGNKLLVGYGLNNIFRFAHVEVYQRNGTSWTKQGQTIISDTSNGADGKGVDLSRDGSTFVITSVPWSADVYEFVNNEWQLKGTPVSSGGSFSAVALSGNGNRLAISRGYPTSTVTIYDYIAGEWVEDGFLIDNQSGKIAFDESGTRLLCGLSTTNYANVYQKENGTWSALGGNIVVPNTNTFWNAVHMDFLATGDRFSMSLLNASNQQMKVVAYDLVGDSWIARSGDIFNTPNPNYTGAGSEVTSDGYDIIISDARYDGYTGRLLYYTQQPAPDGIPLNIKVYLEGSLLSNGGQISSDGHPLMRNDLNNSPFTQQNYIPSSDPYTYPTTVNDLLFEKYIKVGAGLIVENTIIPDPGSVFSVTGDDAIVDWVFVELRDENDMSSVLSTRSGLLQRDGDVVDLDGSSLLMFDGMESGAYYVAVRHRNHLGAMSLLVQSTDLIDFTSTNTPVFDFGYDADSDVDYTGLAMNGLVIGGYKALWAGDANADRKVKFTEPASDINVLFGDVLLNSSAYSSTDDNIIGYYMGDFNMNSKAKYSNPDDDVNYFLGTVLFYQENSQFLINFDQVIEQIP